MASLQSPRIKRTRDRLACAECRRRKLRCDRGLPCTSCSRRGDEALCVYQTYQPATAGGQGQGQEAGKGLESRLQYLEQIVQQYAGQDNLQIGPSVPRDGPSLPASDTSTSTTSQSQPEHINGQHEHDDTPGLVNGATHWKSVMKDIQDLRLAIEPSEAANGHDALITEPSETDATAIIFGAGPLLTMEQILKSHMPPRKEVDRLVSAYFRAQAIAAPFIHSTHFRQQYQNFWSDPPNTPTLWVSILFSICHVASNVLVGRRTNQGIDHRFSVAAAHCLALGQYFRPKRFAVESLVLFAHSQCVTSLDLSPDLAPIFGVIGRTATMMGYHQETADMGLSPFETEMRRRLWSIVNQLDMLCSFHFGLPSAVQSPIAAVPPPRNLFDADFDENSAEIPPSRPESEPTGVLFIVAKHRFLAVFNKILKHALAEERSPDDLVRVEKLEEEMRHEFAALPEYIRPRPMSECVFDPSNVVVTRLCILFIYCKCLCVLHRPHVLKARRESIQTCYEVTEQLLRTFTDAYREFAPKGQVETEGWFITSLTWHDFLLGLVAHCLVTLIGHQAWPDLVSVEESGRLLKEAEDICAAEIGQRGKENNRVHALVRSTVQQLESIKNGLSLPQHGFMPEVSGKANGDMDMLDATQFALDDPLWDQYLEQFLDMSDVTQY